MLRGDKMNAYKLIKKLMTVLLIALVASGIMTAWMNVQPALASVSWNF
jgi:hypothetical protein